MPLVDHTHRASPADLFLAAEAPQVGHHHLHLVPALVGHGTSLPEEGTRISTAAYVRRGSLHSALIHKALVLLIVELDQVWVLPSTCCLVQPVP